MERKFEHQCGKSMRTILVQGDWTNCPHCGVKIPFSPVKPHPVMNIILQPLVNICSSHIDEVMNNNEDDDMEHYIYEVAMETIYGKDIFDFINRVIRER
jgi:hypothetical protein